MIIFQNNDDDYNDYRVCIILCNKIDIKKNIYLIAQSNLAREAGHIRICPSGWRAREHEINRTYTIYHTA